MAYRSGATTVFGEKFKRKEVELTETDVTAQELLGTSNAAGVCGSGAEVLEGAKLCGKCAGKIEPPVTVRRTQRQGPVERGSRFCENSGMTLM